MSRDEKTGEGTQEYIYSSSQLAKYYGISIKGMEFYEKKGLIQPQRLGQGKTRRFGLRDSYRLFFTRLFRNCGMSIPRMLDLLQNNSLERVTGMMKDDLSRMRRQLDVMQRTVACLDEMVTLLEREQRGENRCEVVEAGGFYRLFLRRFTGPHDSNEAQTREYRFWNEFLPITNASLLYMRDSLCRDSSDIDAEIGLVISEDDFERFGFKKSDRVSYIAPGRFVHAVIKGDEEQICSPQRLMPMLDYMREHGLVPAGDGFTRLLFVMQTKTGGVRYDEAWIPID